MDRFMIAPFNIGLETDLRPWQIPDESFAQLDNAYVFRGRVKKRFGSTLMGTGWATPATAHLHSRFRISLGPTNGAGLLAGNVPGSKFKVGQSFSVGSVIFTVATAGNVQMLRTDGSAEVATYNTANGAYSITIAALPATLVYFYPTEPVMGLTQYETGTISNQPTWGFDTQFAYTFTGGYWVRSGVGIWHGDDSNFYWSTNFNGVSADKTSLFVSNFQVANKNGIVVPAADDPIWTFDGTTWATFKPLIKLGGAGVENYIVSTARIILPFKDRLVLLNTVETDNTAAPNTKNMHFPNRCRYSVNGNPFPEATKWLEPGYTGAKGAGWVDAPTEEEIVSAGFIKDRLIVFFERSTWELAWTGNQILPFVWQKINTELGSEATFSAVPFDKVLLTIGNTGVNSCTGGNVDRLDAKIPQKIFEIKDKNLGVQRVCGVRDYFTEMVYWAFPSGNQDPVEKYPNRVLVFNYKNGAWAFNDDCITSFGYYEQQTDETWADQTDTWGESNFSWSSAVVQSQFRQIIAGNPQGFVFIVAPDESRNCESLLIAKMTYTAGLVTLVVRDHTLTVGDYICIENGSSIQGIYQVFSIISAHEIQIYAADPGTYLGGATIARVSNLGILSKQWNPYVDKDYSFHLAKIDFNVEKTSRGAVTVDYYPSYTTLSMITEGTYSGAITGTGILSTAPYTLVSLEQMQDQLWHGLFFQTTGDSVQIYIHMSDTQMMDPNIAFSAFELHAMILYTQRTSARL